VDQEVKRLFYEYAWPGNVREFENVIERAMIMCPSDTIQVSDLPRDFTDNAFNRLQFEDIPPDAKLYETLASVEKQLILRALKMANGVQTHAADILGIGKSGLNQKIKKFGLEVSSKN
jgi:two-component system, NtrC family, response regulator